MKHWTVIPALFAALLLSGCGQLLPLLRLPSGQATPDMTLQGIVCEVAKTVYDPTGVPTGLELWVVHSLAGGLLTEVCKRQSDGGQAQRVVVPSNLPSEAEQARKLSPGDQVTLIGELVVSSGVRQVQVRTPDSVLENEGVLPESFPVNVVTQTGTLVVRSLRTR